MIAVHDPAVADRLRRLRAHGMDMSDLARHAARDVVFEAYPERGWNTRMTDIQAALGLCQLEGLDDILAAPPAAGRALHARRSKPFPTLNRHTNHRTRSGPGSPTACGSDLYAQIDRTELMRRLLAEGIPTRRGVMAIHEEASYSGPHSELPHTEQAAREVLMLPLFPDLTDEQQDHVITCLSRHLLRRAA